MAYTFRKVVGLAGLVGGMLASGGPAVAETAVERLTALGLTYYSKPLTADAIGKMTSVYFNNKSGPLIRDGDCEIVGGMPQLKYLSFYLAKISKACVEALAKATLLEQVTFSGVRFGPGAIAALEKLQDVKDLTFDRSYGIPVSEFGSILKLSKLEKLKMTHGHNFMYGDSVNDQHVAVIVRHKGIRRLDLNGADVTDAGARSISGMVELRELSLANTLVSESGLSYIGTYATKLEKLDVSQTRMLGKGLGNALARSKSLMEIKVSEARVGGGLGPLGKIPTLKEVWFSNTGATDEDIAGLSQAKRVMKLMAGGNWTLTDGALRHIAGMNELRQLDLRDASVSDKGLAGLSALKKLSDFGCESCALTDSAVVTLAKLPLTKIVLNRTGITDAGLEKLLENKSLQYVNAYYTKLTKEGVAKLKAARKQVYIYH